MHKRHNAAAQLASLIERNRATTKAILARTPSLQVQAAEHLCALQKAMQHTGMHTRYFPPEERPPRLIVSNVAAAQRSETIYAAPRNSGADESAWWFWSEQGDQLCRVEQIEAAARQIALLLSEGAP